MPYPSLGHPPRFQPKCALHSNKRILGAASFDCWTSRYKALTPHSQSHLAFIYRQVGPPCSYCHTYTLKLTIGSMVAFG